jgi:SOS-response transcriptional repressor LexA
MDMYPVPLMGSLGALENTYMVWSDSSKFIMTKSHTPYRRFAIQVLDDGLDSFGLVSGSYAIFREQGWPNNECQICVIAFGDEATIRLMENIYSTEPTLRVSGDRINPIEPHRNDFIVLGVLDGVIHQEFACISQGMEEAFDWGC